MPDPFAQRRKAEADQVQSPDRVLEQTRDRRVQERRTWVARSSAVLIVFGLCTLSLIVVRRDRAHQATLVRALKLYVTVLEDTLAKTGYLPAGWDVGDLEHQVAVPRDAFNYVDGAMREYALAADVPTMIAWSEMMPKMLGADGRAVAVFNGGHIDVVWMSEGEFRRRLDKQEARFETRLLEIERQPIQLPRRDR
jgi:hypothetical protein